MSDLLRHALLTAICAVALQVAGADQATFHWTPPALNTDGSALTNLVGYRVYHGFVSGNYVNVHNVGNVTSATITGLLAGASNYLAVTACDSSGIESPFSGEILWTGPAQTDADHDGMPDSWEKLYGGTAGLAPDADADGDGMSNLSEFRAGTAPNDSNSVLAVTGLSLRPVTLRWQSATGHLYTVSSAASPTQPFRPAATGIVATPPVNAYTVTNDDGRATTRFYRIEIGP